jgi:hypothetical protein
MAGGSVANGLAADPILLSGEVKGHVTGLENAGNMCGGGVKLASPIEKMTSQSWKGWESVPGPLLQYSPGRRRNKKAMMARSTTLVWQPVEWGSAAMAVCWWTSSATGTGRT